MTIDSSCNTVTLLTVSSLIRISAATIAHLQLTAAFRSLSRPSSAPCTKASSLRSYLVATSLPRLAFRQYSLALLKIQDSRSISLTWLFVFVYLYFRINL